MDWKNTVAMVGALATLLITVCTMWYQLDSKIERKIDTLNVRFNRVESLLTDNLIKLNRDIGELAGRAHTHTHQP